MKTASWLKSITAAAVFTLTCLGVNANTITIPEQHDRVGNGIHMYTTLTIDSDGYINAVTRLKNSNNFRGWTCGVYAVLLDEDGNALYITDIHNYGIKASGFKKKVERVVSWDDQVPEEYLSMIDSISIVQLHNPSHRVWKWVKNHKTQIISGAVCIAKLYIGIQTGGITTGVEAVSAVLSSLAL